MCTGKTLDANTLCDTNNCNIEGTTFNHTNENSRWTINATNYQSSHPITGNSFQGVVVHGNFTATTSLPARKSSEAVGVPNKTTHEEVRPSRSTKNSPLAESQSFFLNDFRSSLIRLIQTLVSPVTFITGVGGGDRNEM
ncbi:hypothetical protein PQX77_009639 [Marasmius sp. AFHP31]|nr:hypothetical protein PQX77_009639 [Marasmius sp. AFHP31]